MCCARETHRVVVLEKVAGAAGVCPAIFGVTARPKFNGINVRCKHFFPTPRWRSSPDRAATLCRPRLFRAALAIDTAGQERAKRRFDLVLQQGSEIIAQVLAVFEIVDVLGEIIVGHAVQ
jgi:hypothetical protein